MIHAASLPKSIRSVARSTSAGLRVQYVSSSTGQLSFLFPDLNLNGNPSLSFDRLYNSGTGFNNGFGRGWTTTYDDQVRLTDDGAVLTTAGGDVVHFVVDINGTAFKSVRSGHSKHKNLRKLNADTLAEQISARITRLYSRSGDVFYLSAVDFGAAGRINIRRDARGRILSVENTERTLYIDLSWSDDGMVAGLNDSGGRNMKFIYDGDMLVSHVDVAGSRWRYVNYDGRLLQLIDPLGTKVLDVEYVGARVAETTTISGAVKYDYLGPAADTISTTRISDARGDAVELSHNALGQVTSVRALGNRMGNLTLTYDDEGYRTSIVTDDKTFRFEYDQGRLTAFDNGKYRRAWSYDDDGRLLRATDAASSISYDYDSANQIIAGNSSKSQRSYSATRIKGRTSQLRGQHTAFAFEYTAEGRIAGISGTNPKASVSFGYDKAGHLVSERVANTYSATARRNARGQLLEWSDSMGRSFTFVRDERGALTRVTNTRGDWAQASRDATGRIVELTNSQGQSRSFVYDGGGRLTAWTDALQRAFQVEYDATTGVATRMTHDSGLSIVRNANGEAVFQHEGTTSASVQSPAGSPADDGWMDPLYGTGLLGTFSGQTSYSAMEIVRTPGTSVPPMLVPMLEEVDGDSGDSGGGGDSGDGGDFGGDSDTDMNGPGDDYNAVNQADCNACTTAYQISCENTRDSSQRQAYRTADAADIACGVAVVSGGATLVGLGCLAVVEVALQNALDNADTAYDNCVILISQNCWARCH